MMRQCTLVIIFNHRYDANIEKLDKIYGKRFSDILFLVPFYNGSDNRVIPVYESSFQFQGYIAQGYKQIIEHDSKHYLFIGDDLILDPSINENNYQKYFNLEDDCSFIDGVDELADMKGWIYEERFLNAFLSFSRYNGTEYKSELMDSKTAFEIADKIGYNNKKITVSHFMKSPDTKRKKLSFIRKNTEHFYRLLKGYRIPYPLWGGYSDIVIIAHDDLESFSRMCGIFAAQDLFVEIAIPTAMMLNCKEVRFLRDINKKSKVMWTEEEKTDIELQYEKSYSRLESQWPKETSYIHPVKLSRWSVE